MEEKKKKWSTAKLTKEQWVARAVAKYGDKYDYSESEYLNGMAPILIRCKKHNLVFRTIAGNFINERSNTHCPICYAEMKAEQLLSTAYKNNAKDVRIAKDIIKGIKNGRLTMSGARKPNIIKAPVDYKKVFLDKVKEMYGDKYDLSKTEYKTRDTKLTMICKEHGEFHITPRTLLYGSHGVKPHGCPICEGIKQPVKTNPESFKSEMKKIYGRKLKFKIPNKITKDTQITAICKHHGEITHSVGYFKSGKGCEYCSGKKTYWPDFIKLAREVHGDKYDYSLTEIPKRNADKITIICPEHGQFRQFAWLHLSGSGCPECVGYPNRKTREQRENEFIQKARDLFGDKFDYSKVHYVNNDTNVTLTCKEHHIEFETSPDTHLRGSGACPMCTRSIGEAKIYGYLSRHKIKLFTQHKIEHNNPLCKRQYLVVDFYIPEYNVVIEYNGKQHYQHVEFFHSDGFTLEDQKIRDNTLVDILTSKGIRLLTIKYNKIDEIDDILNREFGTLQ